MVKTYVIKLPRIFTLSLPIVPSYLHKDPKSK